MNRKRDIYIQVENIHEVKAILTEIKGKEDNMKTLFAEYDRLNEEENRIFENWTNYIEEMSQRMDHMGL